MPAFQVLSMSLGGGGNGARGSCGSSGNPLREAVCAATAAGVTVVVAAGNEDSNLALSDPASFPEALTVTAMGDSDGKSGGGRRHLPGCRTVPHQMHEQTGCLPQ